MKNLLKNKNFLCVVFAIYLFLACFCQIGFRVSSSSVNGLVANAVDESFAQNIDDQKSVTESATGERKTNYFANYDAEVVEESYQRKSAPDLFGRHEQNYYPSVDNVLALSNEQLDEIIGESIEIFANVEDDIEKNQLKKHKSADGQFYGTIPDDAPRVRKTISINRMLSSRHWLGVFAPAGEVLTVTVDEKAIEQTKNNDKDNQLSIIIGYPFWENNISKTSATDDRYSRMKNAGRMPYLLKEFKLTKTVTKIGSPFGGMVFLSNVPGSVKQNFKITIDGGVDNPSYKLGVSSKNDWQKILNGYSPMVYIQTQYINFMAPKSYVKDIDGPDNALTFWNNAVMLSNYAMSLDCVSEQIRPVIMMFDNFVPGGSALCYPGLFAAICPTNWIGGSLNYKNLTTTAGGWGTIHEMNHNFQYPLKAGYHGSRQWSVGDKEGDFMEITNNVNNVMAFILYTDIASSRTETAPPSNGNWGVTVDPFYNLQHLLSCSQSAGDGFSSLGGNRVYAYIDLIHSFGVDKFLHFLRQMSGGEPTEHLTSEQVLENSNYMRTEDHFAVFASKFFGRDMVDYFTKTLHFNLSEEAKQEIWSLNLKKHFSLQNLYAMGEVDALTGKPFIVDSNEQSVVLKLHEMTVTNAENFKIISISNIVGGDILDNNDGTYILNFDDDSVYFDINFEVWDNGDDEHIEKTLRACVQRAVNFSVEGVEFVYNRGTDGTDITRLIQNKDDQSEVQRKFRAGNFSTSVTNGDSFTRFRANVVFPQDQKVTFMVYGDDVTALRIDGKIAVCNMCVTDWHEFYQYDQIVAREDNKIVVDAKANCPILVEAYCLNLGGGGNIKVSYSVGDSQNYSGIMLTDCVNAEATSSEIEQFVEQEKHPHVYDTVYDLQENALDRMYSNSLSHTGDIESVKAIDEKGREVRNPADPANHKVENIYDGNNNTWFSVPTGSYPLPHFYIFKFREKISLNSVSLRFYNQSYAIRGYEYHVGNTENQDDWSLVMIKDNSKGETFCEDTFPTVTGQYFIIKVTGAGTNGYTNFVEITFNQALDKDDETNIYSSKENEFNYSQNWKEQKGGYINGVAKSTDDGEFSFVLDGKDLLLYSQNEASEIFIDSEKYFVEESDDVGQPSLFVQGLSNEKHIVKVVGKNMIFDAVKTTGKIYAPDLSTLDLSVTNFEYDGTVHKPEIVFENRVLVENVDYTIKSCENKKLGKTNFQVEGVGSFRGVLNSSFMTVLNVNDLDLENVEISFEKEQKYSGKVVEPKPKITIRLDGEVLNLTEGEDFEVQYENNLNPGTATMDVTFKGKFYGTKQVDFIIEKPAPVAVIAGASVGGGAVAISGVATLSVFLVKRKRKKLLNS